MGLKLILKENLFLSDLPLFIIVLAVLIVLSHTIKYDNGEKHKNINEITNVVCLIP